MTLPTMLPHGRDELVAWCRGVDEGPWASLAVPERVAAVEAVGADEVILVPTTADPTELEATAEALR